jgi:pullulanase
MSIIGFFAEVNRFTCDFLILGYYKHYMKIRIEGGTDRRMAWTDRKNGYLELFSSRAGDASGGYFRGDRKYLADFFISLECDGTVDLYRTNALYTDVAPDGFTVAFEHCAHTLSLDVSLLVDEAAFAITLERVSPFAACGAGILLASAANGPWERSERDGITIWTCMAADGAGGGIAFASTEPFRLETAGGDRVILFADRVACGAPMVSTGAKARPAASSASHSASLAIPRYLAFGANAAAAREQAFSLARIDALAVHKEKIAAFLANCTSNSGNRRFDFAVKWAQFSAWMMVTGEGETGIWAGLPWFRDNWGRDTFIALSGTLLVSGRFGEARRVLADFARHQNRNPESPDYGRLPNRYRSEHDVIYNSADGTLWFIRALWEYAEYTRDLEFLREMKGTVDLALGTDIDRRTDHNGFLLHGDADTWMDARIHGDKAWSPRGDRACEIQALWYTALVIGAKIARLHGETEKTAARAALASRVQSSFRRLFWCPDRNALADRLPPGAQGEWLRDWRVRPNQLFAISVPAILSGADEDGERLVDSRIRARILENVNRELVTPFGLYSLSPDDPLFHPRHENPALYYKDAAYHNGTVWFWTSGAYVSAAALQTREGNGIPSAVLPHLAAQILQNEADLILDIGCVGTLGECASPGENRLLISGTWSQTWGDAEFARNVYQDIIGFNPRLTENRIELTPHVPFSVDRWTAEPTFGPGWRLAIDIERTGKKTIRCRATWKLGGANGQGRATDTSGANAAGPAIADEPASATADESAIGDTTETVVAELPPLTLNGVCLEPGKTVEFLFAAGELPGPLMFTRHALSPEWCAAACEKNWLERLVLSGRLESRSGGGLNAAALEWLFDSDYFRRKYDTRLALGALYTDSGTTFRLWAPTARSVHLVLYPDGNDSPASAVLPLVRKTNADGMDGIWELAMDGDLHGAWYRFRVLAHGIARETADPYARAVGVNGKRSMVVDLARTDPEGWDHLAPPRLASANDAIVYEVHVADVTSSPSWAGDPAFRRTYLGAAELGTSQRGVPTGFDHIARLGVTHVQLMPVFDFSSVDERKVRDSDYLAKPAGGAFNWGYDPENYSAPEGSFSTDPRDGAARIRELKTLIARFLESGIGVVMDVVYNHVPSAQDHPLGVAVPGYYFRLDSFSGAGDDTASERAMFRAYMIDSLSYWLAEYKLSGFRFDLMGLHDIETMNAVASALRKIRPDVLLYGEGWDMYRAGKMMPASMFASRKLAGYGFFNDAFRNGVKGSVFDPYSGGFIHDGGHREAVKFGLVGAVYHPQVHNRDVDGTANPNPWGDHTSVSVNYVEIHDNSTLYDKLVLVEPDRSEAYYERLQKTAIGLTILAQGMPVLHAGMEFMRTKEIPADLLEAAPGLSDLYRSRDGKRAFSHNSYNLTDRVNGLDWDRAADKQGLVDYVRKLIALRLAHPLFRLRTDEDIVLSVTFVEPGAIPSVPALYPARAAVPPPPPLQPAPLVMLVSGATVRDVWQGACLIVNPSIEDAPILLPASPGGGRWHLVTDGDFFLDAGSGNGLVPGSLVMVPAKALYLYAEF